jgi:DNA-binding beta-propeller fold protein YncE
MEENIQKILDEKYENVVQFNLINTTNQNQFVDLFNSADLTGIPFNLSPIYTPNTLTGTFNYAFTGGYFSLNQSNGDIYVGNAFSNLLYVYNSNGALITSISIGFPFVNTTRNITYNPSNNYMYVSQLTSANVSIIDCSNYTLLTTIPLPNPVIQGAFCTNNNSMYFTSTAGFVYVLDSFFLITTIPVSPQPLAIVYDSTHNRMYFPDVINVDLNYVDCSTNTYVNIAVPLPLFSIVGQYGASFCNLNDIIYFPFGISNNTLCLFDTNTNTFLPNLSFGGTGTANNVVFDSNQNLMYASFGFSTEYIIYFNPLTNTQIGSISSSFTSPVIGFNNFNNQLVSFDQSSNFFETYTTANVYSSPYFVTGSANYNAFINNLNNEPVFIQMVRLLVQNQDQLNNQLQLTKIDSNGNQIFMPNFPINEVSAYQQQGNIGEVAFKDIVFDGRTYINQYQLNAYESMSFEIYYKQLDLTTATATYPIFFKPKVQLKEYIKKELNL